MEARYSSSSLFSTGAKKALNLLKEAGFEAFLIGGAVRDHLLGKEPTDRDIVTSAPLEEIREIFKGEKILCPYGEKHGTLTVRIDKENIEISTYRHDEGEEANLATDLHHRDLTINSMAMDENGLIDLCGGEKDLKEGIIRFNTPMDRVIKEDPLRILRAIRFHATLGFKIEEESRKLIHENCHLLSEVAKERVNKELSAILLADDIFDILQEYKDVMFVIFPILKQMDGYDQNSPWHCYDLYTHTIHVVAATKPDLILRVSALFHDIGKLYTRTEGIKDDKPISHYYGHPPISAKKAKEILLEQKLLISKIPEIYFYIAEHDRKVEPNRKSVGKFLYLLNKTFHKDILDHLDDFFNLQKADRLAHAIVGEQAHEECFELAKQMIEEGVPLDETELDISGKEIEAIGFEKEGISKAKTKALLAVIEGRIPNENEALKAYVRMLHKSGFR